VLPIESGKARSIALIGDDAGPHVTIGLNGSGHVYATRVSVPIDAIAERAGDAINVVTLTLNRNSFAAWDESNDEWKVYPGAYSIMVGSSSRDIRLKASLNYQ
jgi:hypothetical protein